MTIHRDFTIEEIFLLRKSELTIGDYYVPKNQDNILLKVNNSKEIVDTEYTPVFINTNSNSNDTASTAVDIKFRSKGFLTLNPENQNYKLLTAGVGLKFSNASDSQAGIAHTTHAIPYEGNIMLFQYRLSPKIVSKSGSILSTVPIDAGNGNEQINRVTCAVFDGGTGLMAIASELGHTVKVFSRSPDGASWSYLYTVGINSSSASSNSYEATGKLTNPHAVAWHPNGNLIISCYAGKGTNDYYAQGYVGEFNTVDNGDGTYTTTLVNVLMGNTVANQIGSVGDNQVRTPKSILSDPLDSNLLYVVEFDTHNILKYDLSTHKTVSEYPTHNGVSGYHCDCFGIIDNGNTIVRTNNARQVIATSVSTGDQLWVKDATKELAYPHSGYFTDTNIIQVDDYRYLLTDSNNNRTIFDTNGKVSVVNYVFTETPEEISSYFTEFEKIALWGVPKGCTYDMSTLSVTAPLERIDELGPVLLELRRK